MFKKLMEKVSSVIGHEAERQNAIARFGTGISIGPGGMVDDPRKPGDKIHVDDFTKLPVKDRMPLVESSFGKLADVKQIRPEDVNAKEVVALLRSSAGSLDDVGRQMREARESEKKIETGQSMLDRYSFMKPAADPADSAQPQSKFRPR